MLSQTYKELEYHQSQAKFIIQTWYTIDRKFIIAYIYTNDIMSGSLEEDKTTRAKKELGGVFWSKGYTRSGLYAGHKSRNSSREDIDFPESIYRENAGEVQYNVLQAQINLTTSQDISINK